MEGVIFAEERLERLTQSITDLDLESSVVYDKEIYLEDKTSGISAELGAQEMLNETTETVQLSEHNSITETATDDDRSGKEHRSLKVDSLLSERGTSDVVPVDPATKMDSSKQESVAAGPISEFCDSSVYDIVDSSQPTAGTKCSFASSTLSTV